MISRAFQTAMCFVLVCAAGRCAGYPQNLLSQGRGASVSTSAKLEPGSSVESLLSDEVVSKGGFTFSRVDQDRDFIVDLGGVRSFDRVQFGAGNYGQDLGVRRLAIEVSSKSPDGPFKRVLSTGPLGFYQILRLPPVEARWIRFDLGRGVEGAHVHSVRIYKGYQHPSLSTVTRLLYERTAPGIPALSRFYAAAKAADWAKACRLLRAYYASREKADPPNPKYDLTRAQALAAGTLDFAGIVRQEKVPIDWSYSRDTDWYEHKNFLNRGSPLGVPVDAYWNTGDERWARLFRDIFYDWIEANPKPEVMHRADYPTWRTLDSALRSDWLVTRFTKVTHGKAIDDELWANYLYSIWEHADYLKHDETDGGNWLAMVSAAVMRTALMFEEFADCPTWLAFGKTAFELNVMRDIHPDGKECEDSPGYVNMAYAGMFGTLMSLDKAGISVKPEVRRRMNKALDFIGAALQPNNRYPNIGDGGGAIGYDLFGPMRYFQREDLRYILTQGKEGTPPAAASVTFPDGGWSILRSSYDERPYTDARHLVFKTSSASHGHPDVLSLTLYAYGRELLIDPGITSYEGADVQRYTQTIYHNTVCVDGRNQGGAGETQRWITCEGLDYVRGVYRGYKGITHTRSVLFVKPEYWVVWDEIAGDGEHSCDANWHFPPDADPTGDEATGFVHTRYASGGNLLIAPVSPLQATAGKTDYFVAGGGPGEPRDIPAQGWHYTSSGPLPQRMAVVMYPYTGAEVPHVTARRLETDSTACAAAVTAGNFTDYLIVRQTGSQQICVPEIDLVLDGEAAIVRVRAGQAISLSAANVRSVFLGGQRLIDYAEPTADVAVTLSTPVSR